MADYSTVPLDRDYPDDLAELTEAQIRALEEKIRRRGEMARNAARAKSRPPLDDDDIQPTIVIGR